MVSADGMTIAEQRKSRQFCGCHPVTSSPLQTYQLGVFKTYQLGVDFQHTIFSSCQQLILKRTRIALLAAHHFSLEQATHDLTGARFWQPVDKVDHSRYRDWPHFVAHMFLQLSR